MSYFAKISNDIVTQVIVVNDDINDGAQFAHDLFGGVWVETLINTLGKNYASIGYTYDAENQNFIAPKPYPSWILNDSYSWQAPTDYPTDGKVYVWDETSLNWILKNSNLL